MVTPAALQQTLRRSAPRLSLRLSSPSRHGPDRAWIQVEAQRVWLEQQGQPHEWVVAPIRALL